MREGTVYIFGTLTQANDPKQRARRAGIDRVRIPMEPSKESKEMELDMQSQAHIGNMLMSFVKSFALKAAIELGIAEAISQHGRPMNVDQLAEELSLSPAKAPPLAQLMRMLEHAGLFAKQQDGYVLTPLSRWLLLEGPAFVRGILHPCLVSPMANLASWFRGDDPTAFHTANGKCIWEYATENEEFRDLFNQAMASDSKVTARQVVGECSEVFEGLESLVDVGGGTGVFARSIAEALPGLKCTVYDLPHVVGSMVSDEKVEFVGGSMFEYVPPAEAVILKMVLHNHGDEACLKILENCRKAINSKGGKGKLIIVDVVLNVTKGDHFKSLELQLGVDMQMMALMQAKERDQDEWKNLFAQAGFINYKIKILTPILSLIEVYP